MSNNEDTFCVLENDKILNEIREDINNLRTSWKDDIKQLRTQLNKLDRSIDDIDRKYNTIKPEINAYSSNIHLLLTQIYEQHKTNITYSNIFKLSSIPIIMLILKKLL